MTDAGRSREELTPAEKRLVGLLLLLQAETRRLDASLTSSVMRRVRLQFATRALLHAIGSIAGAVADALAILVRAKPGSTRR